MKVFLINPPTESQPVVRDMAGGLGFGAQEILPSIDLAYLAASLLKGGYKVRIIDSDVEKYQAYDVYQLVKQEKPEIIIASVSLPTIYEDCLFLKQIRKYSSSKVLAKTGITDPDILREILEKSSADIGIFGECDLSIGEILEGSEKRGTAYLDDGELIVEENNIVTNMDELPIPSRELLPNKEYHYALLGNAVTTMQTSRGCPFPCSYYCPYPLVQGKKWRFRSPEHVVQEIEDIVKRHKIRKILFRDATFTFNIKRAEEICELILYKDLSIDWWCETRIDHM